MKGSEIKRAAREQSNQYEPCLNGFFADTCEFPVNVDEPVIAGFKTKLFVDPAAGSSQ
jgi:hypothetical protein